MGCWNVGQAKRQAAQKGTSNGSAATASSAGEKRGGGGGGGTNRRRGRGSTPPVDEDPQGLTLLAKDPLPEAAKLVAILTAHAGAFVETHVLAFDVALKRGKFLMAARAVTR